MSFPEYKDFAKEARDAHQEDYDTDCAVTVNSEGPNGVSLRTATTLNPGGTGPFPTTLNVQWAHSSGFAVESLEVSSCNNMALSASLANLAPGLTMKFDGEKSGAARAGAVYNHKMATAAVDMDVAGMSALNASVLGGAGAVQAGAAASFGIKGGFQVVDYSAAFGWTPKEGTFAGVQATDKFTNLNATLMHRVQPNLSVTAMADYGLKTSAAKVSVGTVFDCCKHCAIKVKVDNEGMVNASVKREFPSKKFTVGSAAAVNVNNLQSYSVGLTATVG